jgi:hypothetical protein
MRHAQKRDSLRNKKADQSELTSRGGRRVRLPGFLIEEDIGLGDVIKKTTYAMGIKPCGGCERRAAALNRWLTFTR